MSPPPGMFPPMRFLCLLVAPLAMAACSTMSLPDAPRTVGKAATPNPHYKVGAPYKVAGRWYAPKVDAAYDEVGLASWYGGAFQGKLTANGEVFDKRRLSAAHKTLPMPTLAEVENLENGRRIVVRVNDRGPFVDERIIDLSQAAASELGFADKGLARVRVRYLGETQVTALAALPGDPAAQPIRVAAAPARAPARPPASVMATAQVVSAADIEEDALGDLIAGATAMDAAAPLPPLSEIWVELAALDDLSALEEMRLDVPDLGPVTVQSGDNGGKRVQSLRVGPFLDEAMAFASLTRARGAGFGAARIVRGVGG